MHPNHWGQTRMERAKKIGSLGAAPRFPRASVVKLVP